MMDTFDLISRYKDYKSTDTRTNEDLCLAYQHGEYAALDELTKRNVMLLFHGVQTFMSHAIGSMNEDDYIQQAYLGFYAAVCKFQQDSASKFATYAMYWIRDYLQKYEFQDKPVHISQRTQVRLRQVNKFVTTYQAEHGQEPDDKIIQDTFQFSEKEMGVLRDGQAIIVHSYDTDTQNEDGSITSYLDAIDNGNPSTEDLAIDELEPTDTRCILLKMIDCCTLTDRDRALIEDHFGFTDGAPHSLTELSQKYNISCERARTIKNDVIARMRIYTSMKPELQAVL